MNLSDEIYKQYEDATDPFMRAVLLRWFSTASEIEETAHKQENYINKLNTDIEDLDRELHEAIQDPEND